MNGQDKPKAAVALIRLKRDDPEYFILKRAENSNDPWSGQLAFPGGKCEMIDSTLMNTAIRETREECGFSLNDKQVVEELPLATAGKLAGTTIKVQPYLFELEEKPEVHMEPKEVSATYWVKESHFLSQANHRLDAIYEPKPSSKLPYTLIEDNEIFWGFSYKVLMMFLKKEKKIGTGPFKPFFDQMLIS